uniref:Transporter n=1 Tax=Ciona savignyi TaxID=51511 RepID=H2ZG31_CIOSA
DGGKKLRERDVWSGKFDFLLACCGTAVGLGNVWRFPYLCYKNGGGKFYLVYVVFVHLSGVPIFFLEVAIGQFTKLGAIKSWTSLCPLISGIGIASAVIVFYTLCYYAVILAWALFYLFQSFRAELPWANCNNTLEQPSHMPGQLDLLHFHFARCVRKNSQRQTNMSRADKPILYRPYFERKYVLQITDGIDDLGGLRWELAGVLLLAWVICYLTVFQGTKSTGKAMYFTATFPYVMLLILLVRGVTLPGAWKGIKYYITPNITKLGEPEVWIDAGTQVFFSYSLCIGVLVSLGSFNAYNNNCLSALNPLVCLFIYSVFPVVNRFFFDTVIIAGVNSGTSILAGFAIFAALGFMATEQGVSMEDVAAKGPGLAFIAYPKEVLLLPVSQLWSCLFFVMIFLLGISTLLTDTLALVTSLGDLYPQLFRGGKYRKLIAMAAGCFACYLVGLTMVTRAIIIFNIIKYDPLTYNKTYNYPAWGHAIGWGLALSSIIMIPLRAIYILCKAEG